MVISLEEEAFRHLAVDLPDFVGGEVRIAGPCFDFDGVGPAAIQFLRGYP